MFAWQIALGVELLVVLVALLVFLKAANAEAGPRTFVKLVAVIVAVLATLLAACTLTKAVLKTVYAEEAGPTTFFIIFTDEPEPAPVRFVPSPPAYKGAKTTGVRGPVPEWKGDLRKAKWHERGEMMKRKWAERGN
jgi:hypothetical protein